MSLWAAEFRFSQVNIDFAHANSPRRASTCPKPSLEIRRFGFNLDHGGVNGGLKVLVDDVQQNQGTQGHGQGYLGALKALSPELISEVNVINGPFSPEYGDLSGLGVVHIKQRESLPDEFTARLQGGNFNSERGFLAYSPNLPAIDSYLAYDGSHLDGPFQNPSRYRRDNANGNLTKALDTHHKLGFRLIFGRNDFYSSGQIPLDLVNAGLLDRFGYTDPTDGGRVKLGTISTYYSNPPRTGMFSGPMGSWAVRCSTSTPTSRSFFTTLCTAMPSSSTIPGSKKAAMRSINTRMHSGERRRYSLPESISTTTRSMSGCTRARGGRPPA